MKLIKVNKACDVLSSGGYFLGLNSSLSSPTSEQISEKGGGGGEQHQYIPDNQALVINHRPTCYLTPSQPRPGENFVVCF